MRQYFKELKINKQYNKLRKFAEKNNADYIEKEGGITIAVWKMSKKHGKYRLAIAIRTDGLFHVGRINPDCDNFEHINEHRLVTQEAEWLMKVLPLVQKFKEGK